MFGTNGNGVRISPQKKWAEGNPNTAHFFRPIHEDNNPGVGTTYEFSHQTKEYQS